MKQHSPDNDRAVIETIAAHFGGSRWLQGYARGKLRTDPAYGAVFELLRERREPVLDIGCGLGLLSFYLREHGVSEPILGVDRDAAKIARACRIAAAHYTDLRFECKDALDVAPGAGTVVMLDLLHYLGRGKQVALLASLAESTPLGGIVIIRATPRDRTWRFLMTRMEEVFMWGVGWIRGEDRLYFPTVEELAAPFRAHGFREEIRPLWGRTPFNSYLFVFSRPSIDDLRSGRGKCGE